MPDPWAGPQNLAQKLGPQTCGKDPGLQTLDPQARPQLSGPWVGCQTPDLSSGPQTLDPRPMNRTWDFRCSDMTLNRTHDRAGSNHLQTGLILYSLFYQYYSKCKAKPDLISIVISEIILFLAIAFQAKGLKVFYIQIKKHSGFILSVSIGTGLSPHKKDSNWLLVCLSKI